jgi:hypothetical protein
MAGVGSLRVCRRANHHVAAIRFARELEPANVRSGRVKSFVRAFLETSFRLAHASLIHVNRVQPRKYHHRSKVLEDGMGHFPHETKGKNARGGRLGRLANRKCLC